jgi:transcriptional repressor NrdR
MMCPSCNRPTRVAETRSAEDGGAVRRRRHCPSCGARFTTFERPEAARRFVRKRSGRREAFDVEKLRGALSRATHKRDVSRDGVEAIVRDVVAAIDAGGGELPAARIGELCLERLLELDRGAYLQFAGTLPQPNAEFAASGPLDSVRAERKHHQSTPHAASRRGFHE